MKILFDFDFDWRSFIPIPAIMISFFDDYIGLRFLWLFFQENITFWSNRHYIEYKKEIAKLEKELED